MSAREPSMKEIAARMAITDVLHQYCRAMDRMDRSLALSCWHAGGTDEHTPLFSGTAVEFVDWVWTIHEPMLGTRHCLSNIIIEVDGERAWSESYWNVMLRTRRTDATVDVIGGGRYIDFFECIDDLWAMRHRRSIHDWDRVESVRGTMADDTGGAAIMSRNPNAKIYSPTRDLHDPSYAFLGGHQLSFQSR